MSKGSNRRKEDFKAVQNNWPEINWDDEFIRCRECGQVYKKTDRLKYMKWEDGWICVTCNFN